MFPTFGFDDETTRCTVIALMIGFVPPAVPKLRQAAGNALIVTGQPHYRGRPVLPKLSAEEARIIGSLIEKSRVTPDQYPLTLNALTTACNQKSARNPVMKLNKGEVQRLVRLLSGRNLVRIAENFKSSVEKYTQTFCNTRYNDFKFDEAELALVCVLLLRGAQTPGELRANCRRLHEFTDNDAVVSCLARLMAHVQGPLVVKLPRTPGRKDSEYMHLFSGEIDVDALAASANQPPAAARSQRADLGERVARLEEEVTALKARLEALAPGDGESG